MLAPLVQMGGIKHQPWHPTQCGHRLLPNGENVG
jgi:hypothetical protein